jgi:2'-5' RNA ligase
MGKTHKTAVVVIPPHDVWEPIQAIRRQHDRKVRRWMPHITVIYPFCDEADLDDRARQTATECRTCCSFELTLTSFQTFSHRKGHHTVWLKPEPDESLADLHAVVWAAVSYDEDFKPRVGRFTPHLSVGQVRGRERRDKLLLELRSCWSPIRFRVTQIEFIARGDPPDDIFRVTQTIPLGAEN